MATKDWKKSGVHTHPRTKIAWETENSDYLEIRHVPSSNIPYKLIVDGYKEVDSANSFARAMKLATNWRRTH